MSETKSEMIRRVLIKPMMARYRLPDRFSSVEAGIEDYTEAMLPFREDAIAEGFRRVKIHHEYPWWPDLPKLVSSVRTAASEASVRGEAGSSERAAIVARANARGPSYARWYMGQMGWPHVKAAWSGGYFREMRDYLAAAAMRQILDGANEPHVEVPDEMISRWAAAAHRLGLDQPPSKEAQESLESLLASIRAKAALLSDPAKQPHEAAE